MENNDKRVLRVALDDEIKKVTITGKDADEKVVMRQELNEEDLDNVTGGAGGYGPSCRSDFLPLEYDDFFAGLGCPVTGHKP